MLLRNNCFMNCWQTILKKTEMAINGRKFDKRESPRSRPVPRGRRRDKTLAAAAPPPLPSSSPTAAVGACRRAKPVRCRRRRPCLFPQAWQGGAGSPLPAAVPPGLLRSGDGCARLVLGSGWPEVAAAAAWRWVAQGRWWRRPLGPDLGPSGLIWAGRARPWRCCTTSGGRRGGSGWGWKDGGVPTAARRWELHEPAGSAGPGGSGLLLMLRPVGNRHWRRRSFPPACPLF
jgi:hypothetical protein